MGQFDHLYESYQWKLRRKAQLRAQPLCQQCMRVHNRVQLASIAHHVEPHHGDRTKFMQGKLVSLCKQCHDSDMQALEKGGRPRLAIGLDGWPIDNAK